jgi:hypothetical protein
VRSSATRLTYSLQLTLIYIIKTSGRHGKNMEACCRQLSLQLQC